MIVFCIPMESCWSRENKVCTNIGVGNVIAFNSQNSSIDITDRRLKVHAGPLVCSWRQVRI